MSTPEKTPNRRLSALMREAGISNKGLAKRMRDLSERDGDEPISPSHTNVDKWLSGATRQPLARTCQVLVKVLSRELGRPVTLDAVGYGGVAPGNAESTLEYPETVGDSVTALTQLASYELRTGEPSKTLQVVPEAWTGLLATWMFGSEVERSRPVEPRAISAIDVQAVRDATVMFANYDYRYGGGRPKPLVARFLETDVLPTISFVSPVTSVGKDYFREAAALTRLAGWTAYDIGQHALAQRYLYHAFRLSRAAGDKALCGRILAGMSHQANFLGHFTHAVHLARAAAQGAQGYATATTMALFYAMEARALASQGNKCETTTAMAAAEKWMAQSEPSADPDWIRYFDHAELHAEFAHCFRDLGESEFANHHAAASIAESKNMYVRSLSFCRTVLATAHLQANELEAALEVARGVVDTAAELRSHRVVSYLADFRRRLANNSSDPIVREFGEYIQERLPSKGGPMSGRVVVA